jgi:CRP/FNR family transcriptional regulator
MIDENGIPPLGEHFAMLEGVPFLVEDYEKGAIIYLEGDVALAVYRIISGCVRLQINSEAGERHIVSFLFPGELFGFSNEERLLSAEAVTPVRLERYSTATLVRLNGHTREFLLDLMDTVEKRVAEFAHYSVAVSHLPAPERLLWFFNWIASRLGGESGRQPSVVLPMSWREVADFLSLKHETLSRALRELARNGHIVREGRRRIRLPRRQFGLGAWEGDGLAMQP